MKKKNENTNLEHSPQIFNVLKSLGRNKFSRREFIEAASLTTTAVVISGCSKPKTSFLGTGKVTSATLYSGPGTRYVKLGQLAKGKPVTINGRNDSSNWFRVSVNRIDLTNIASGENGDPIIGWVLRSSLDYKGESYKGLLVYEAPPTPAPTPTRTRVPTVKPVRTPTRRPSSGGGTICTCNKITYWYPN
jgi:hypothetical protein